MSSSTNEEASAVVEEVEGGDAAFKSESKHLKKKKKRSTLVINLSNCKYDSVRRVAKRFGMRVCNDDDAEWTIYWTDTALPERLSEIKPYQKVNHFPGMNEICRKDLLCRNMNRMLKLFPKDYTCFPRTWTLPADFGDFQSYAQSKKNKFFISKPGSGCQGKGIFLFKGLKDIRPTDHQVCQQYISKPFLLDGFKFDLRIYILVTSCDPLKIYVYHDGLTRLGTVKYREPTGSNLDEFCMHLTNYAINKHSKDFVRDEESGSKRRITTINRWFVENGYNLEKIWADIDDVIIKTMIAAHPVIKHNYRSSFPTHVKGSACFEILGFDILLDRKLKPWLLEVNRSPSFHTDSPLDKEVKEGLLTDTLNLIDLYANDRRRYMEEEKKRVRDRLLFKQKSKETNVHQEEARAKYEANFEAYEQGNLGGFRRIYPKGGNEAKYEKFFDQNTSLCSETVASKARAEMARQLREELEAKQREMEKMLKKDGSANKQSSFSVPVDRNSSASESPPLNRRQIRRKVSAAVTSAVVNRRSISFRLSVPNTETEEGESSDHGNNIVGAPQNIDEEEELQRLAGLQIRESIIREMGMSEQLRTMLESQPCSRVQTPMPEQHSWEVPRPSGEEWDSNGRIPLNQTFVQDSPTRHTHQQAGFGPNSTFSQPSLHAPPTNGHYHYLIHDSSHTAFSSPEHRVGGANMQQLSPYNYRLQRQKRNLSSGLTRVNKNAWELSSFHKFETTCNQTTPPLAPPPVWHRHSLPNQSPPLSLELYGFSIPSAGYRKGRQRGHGGGVSHDEGNRRRFDHGLTVHGHSVSNKLKQQKYSSPSSYLPS